MDTLDTTKNLSERHQMQIRYECSCISACISISENMINYLEKQAPFDLYNSVYKIYHQIIMKNRSDFKAGEEFEKEITEILMGYLDKLIDQPNEHCRKFDLCEVLPIISAIRIIKWTYSFGNFRTCSNQNYITFKRVSEDLTNHMNPKIVMDLEWFKDWPIASQDIKIGYFLRKVEWENLNFKGDTLWFVKERY